MNGCQPHIADGHRRTDCSILPPHLGSTYSRSSPLHHRVSVASSAGFMSELGHQQKCQHEHFLSALLCESGLSMRVTDRPETPPLAGRRSGIHNGFRNCPCGSHRREQRCGGGPKLARAVTDSADGSCLASSAVREPPRAYSREPAATLRSACAVKSATLRRASALENTFSASASAGATTWLTNDGDLGIGVSVPLSIVRAARKISATVIRRASRAACIPRAVRARPLGCPPVPALAAPVLSVWAASDGAPLPPSRRLAHRPH